MYATLFFARHGDLPRPILYTMQSIKWSDYTGETFQIFCNALLSFEISKKFIPFSAPGKDRGIDGTYVGSYDGITGKWRFQDKYHQPSTPVSALTQDIKNEMEKVQDEDNFIMLTSLKVSSTKRDKLIQEGKEALKRLGKREIYIDVWDEAKIFTLYLRFPILKYWLEEGFTNFQLVKYTEAFREPLSSGLDSLYTFNNAFISRTRELEQLHQFLNDPEKRVASISGEAGVGKTRLAIEFFQRYIDRSMTGKPFHLLQSRWPIIN
jgi:hypothetical protein